MTCPPDHDQMTSCRRCKTHFSHLRPCRLSLGASVAHSVDAACRDHWGREDARAQHQRPNLLVPVGQLAAGRLSGERVAAVGHRLPPRPRRCSTRQKAALQAQPSLCGIFAALLGSFGARQPAWTRHCRVRDANTRLTECRRSEARTPETPGSAGPRGCLGCQAGQQGPRGARRGDEARKRTARAGPAASAGGALRRTGPRREAADGGRRRRDGLHVVGLHDPRMMRGGRGCVSKHAAEHV